MGAWSWVARIGGYVAAPFTAGLSIPAGEAIAQGLDNKETVDKTNAALQAGNQQAIDLYGRALNPYMNLGGQATNTLGGLMGFSMGGGAPALPETASPTAEAATENVVRRKGGMSTEGPYGSKRYPHYGTSLADLASAPAQTGSSFGAKGTRTIRMLAPDGSTGDVPEQFAAQLEAKGARRL